MKKLFLLAALFVAATFSACSKHDDEINILPAIPGVPDKPGSSDEQPNIITVETPGTLAELLSGYDKTKITELTVIGNLNGKDIETLHKLFKLAVLDMENANLEVLPQYAFYNRRSLTSVKLPKTLKTIGEDAFGDCSGLTSITIPDSVTTIGSNAFNGCSGLTSITIPDSVTTIEGGAFIGCSSLTSITIPDSVTSIGGDAFWGCSSLTSIYCKALTPPTIEYITFDGVATSTPLYVPIGCADAYRAAQYWREFKNINEMEF